MKALRRALAWGGVLTAMILLVACPWNDLLTDVQERVNKAHGARAETPQFSPIAGTYDNPQTVTIQTATARASVRYTTDGSTPTETVGTLYSAPISVGGSQTVKAIAYEAELADSTVAVAPYAIGLPAQWAQTLTAGTVNAQFLGVAVISSGDLYAAGSCDGTGIYGFGNGVAASGSAGNNVLLVRYNRWGQAQWAATLHGGTPSAYFNSLAVDSSGYVYAAGYSSGTGTYDFGNGVTATGVSTSVNVLLVKYYNYPDIGYASWAQTLTSGWAAKFNGVAVDSSGNVCAVGLIMGDSTCGFGNGVTATGTASEGDNLLLVKYNSSGQAQWAQSNTAGANDYRFYGVAVDSSGNIYAVGYIYGTGTVGFGNGVTATAAWTGNNVLLVKYSSTGQAQWAQTLTAGGGNAGYSGVAVDSSGNVYAVGSGNNTAAFGFGNGVTVTGTATANNVFLVKYNSAGQAQWAQTLTAGTSNAYFGSVELDSAGNIYAAGTVSGSDVPYGFGNGVTTTNYLTGNAPLLVKYNSLGQAQWAQSLTAGISDAYLFGAALDSSGNIDVVGLSSGTGTYGFGSGVTATGTCTGNNVLLVQY